MPKGQHWERDETELRALNVPGVRYEQPLGPLEDETDTLILEGKSRSREETKALRSRDPYVGTEAEGVVPSFYDENGQLEGESGTTYLEKERIFHQYRRELALPSTLTPQQRALLIAFSMSGNISTASQQARTARSNHNRWLTNPEYAEAFERAREIALDRLESTAWKLAVEGSIEPIVSAGRLVAYKRVHDTRLLEVLLKAHKPEKYRERHDVTTGGIPLLKIVELNREDYDAI